MEKLGGLEKLEKLGVLGKMDKLEKLGKLGGLGGLGGMDLFLQKRCGGCFLKPPPWRLFLVYTAND